MYNPVHFTLVTNLASIPIFNVTTATPPGGLLAKSRPPVEMFLQL